jgi:hypothetical protein
LNKEKFWMIKLIGITGPAGVGKDTAGLYLQTKHTFVRYAIAATLKQGLAAMGMPEPENRELKERPIHGFEFTWRQAAQTLGTEWGRALDPDIWLKLCMQKVDTSLIFNSKVVVTDVRFENEADAIRQRGGVILHLRGRAAELGANATHESEKLLQVKNLDACIYNDGDIPNLHEKLERFLKSHGS